MNNPGLIRYCAFFLASALLFATCINPAVWAQGIHQNPHSSWKVPRLEPHKSVQAAKADAGQQCGEYALPETFLVTLKVDAVGDPFMGRVPADVVLELDSTDSMSGSYGGKTVMEWVKEAAINFTKLMNLSGGDRVAVVQFNTLNNGTPNIKLLQGFTNDSAPVISAINSLQPVGQTPFYDATVFSISYANGNHSPPGQVHPHAPPPAGHHKPVVISLTDGISNADKNYGFSSCAKFAEESFNSPPPVSYKGYETEVYIIGMGSMLNKTRLEAIANSGGGRFYGAPTPDKLGEIYKNISAVIKSATAATKPSPLEPMILDVLPPDIIYQGSWWQTPAYNATISNFTKAAGASGTTELRWDVPRMLIGDVFEIRYEIRSSLHGWQSAGVTGHNASVVYGSDFCKVKYRNYRYNMTLAPSDIWTNETNDVSIFVTNPVIIQETNELFALSMILVAAFVCVRLRKPPRKK